MDLVSIRAKLVAGEHVTVDATRMPGDELFMAVQLANASSGHLFVTGCASLSHADFAELARVATDPARSTVRLD